VKRWVKQIDVARQLGIDRTSVNKILNNYPAKFDEATRQKVFQTASRLGYLHPAVTQPKRRAVPRKKFKANASIKVRLQNGSLCSECRCEVVNISSTGMLLRLLAGKQKLFSIPLDPFYLEISLTNSKLTKIPKLKALPIRCTHEDNHLGFGVHFFDLPHDARLRKMLSA